MIPSEAERNLLGQMLLDNSVYLDCPLEPEHFTDSRHKAIHGKIGELVAKGMGADIAVVASELPDVDTAYIAALTSVPTTSNWKYYAEQVMDTYHKRVLSNVAARISDSLGTVPTMELWESVERELVEITSRTHTMPHEIHKGLVAFINDIETRYHERESGKKYPGYETGFHLLDEAIMGLESGKLYYIGARPSKGKSALALGMARHLATIGVKVGFLSLESSENEVTMRLFAQAGRIESRALRTGDLKPETFKRLTDTADTIYSLPMVIDDTPNMSITQLVSKARYMVRMQGCKVLFVDYLQLIDVPGEMPFRERIAKASTSIKELARELRVPVVCVAQLRRDADDRRPHMGDFADSSQIEKDADVAMLLHSETDDLGREWYQLIVEKNRDGSTGDVPVYFEKKYVLFEPRIAGAA